MEFIHKIKSTCMAIKETNITVNVSNLEGSIAFYESIGFTLASRWADHYAQLKAPGILVGLHPSTGIHLTGNSGNVSIGFTADDFEQARSLLQQLSIPFTERQEAGGLFLHFNDPDGTALYFIKPSW
jgi:catechol 2,3-dioxygenase-like lactoylglutathione lyase family enzyme